jgi:hypothetical protein
LEPREPLSRRWRVLRGIGLGLAGGAGLWLSLVVAGAPRGWWSYTLLAATAAGGSEVLGIGRARSPVVTWLEETMLARLGASIAATGAGFGLVAWLMSWRGAEPVFFGPPNVVARSAMQATAAALPVAWGALVVTRVVLIEQIEEALPD